MEGLRTSVLVLNLTPATTFTGPAGSQRSAWSVSCAGDVNGDGYSDIITGHYLGSIGGPTEEGAAFASWDYQRCF
ncbi:MAG: FG-GAP repeat protein [Flavobacteriales bacterium]|nr:FG-GAP repeat protein [Flavobacteriales bacterium]